MCRTDAIKLSFPDRTTPTGKIIDAHLSKKISLQPDGEKEFILETLKTTNIICDRYEYSGHAYGNGDYIPEDIPKPDLLFFIDKKAEDLVNRAGYGKERGENLEFQKKVYKRFMELDVNWIFVDGTIEQMADTIYYKVLKYQEQQHQ